MKAWFGSRNGRIVGEEQSMDPVEHLREEAWKQFSAARPPQFQRMLKAAFDAGFDTAMLAAAAAIRRGQTEKEQAKSTAAPDR